MQTKTKTVKTTKKVTEKPVVFTDQNGLLAMLLRAKGANFVQLETVTEPKMNKRGNPYLDNIEIVANRNVMIGMSYENVVNNARVRDAIADAELEGIDKETLNSVMEFLGTSVANFVEDFTPKEHRWADHSTDPETGKLSRIIVEKRSDVSCKYVQVWVLNTKDYLYRFKDSKKELNEAEIEIMKDFMPKKSSNKEHQGLKKEVKIRDYSLGSIKGIKMNKTQYVIR